MNTYRFHLFLMMEDSASRLISKLVMTGSIVSSPFTAGGFCMKSEASSPTVLFCANLQTKVQTYREYAEQLRSMLRYLEIPYYGFVLAPGSPSGEAEDTGWMPPLKSPSLQSEKSETS